MKTRRRRPPKRQCEHVDYASFNFEYAVDVIQCSMPATHRSNWIHLYYGQPYRAQVCTFHARRAGYEVPECDQVGRPIRFYRFRYIR